MAAVAPPPQSTAAANAYFTDLKKGEVNELKQLLKTFNVERDVNRKRDIIKKVIAYMTLGIDVSRLFSDMIMAIETKDIVVKKMVYHYLSNYAHANPEMAIMCINSLRRDCDNEDPMVRGLALRSLTSLRLESIIEYCEQPLEKALTDLSAYVRKTGVMGVLKVYSLRRSVIERGTYIEQLHRMLDDADATVITNVIFVLEELNNDKGGLRLPTETLMKLFARIGEFSEWGLNLLIDLVARYEAKSEEEIYALMNLIDPVLRSANSGAVLATMRCFINLTERLPDLHPMVYTRAKPPLLTLITTGHPEIQFAILKHLEIILPKKAAQGVFDDEFRQFFVRYNEPPHIKHLKVNLLPMISSTVNSREIAAELREYVTDTDSELSKRSIAALGAIAMRNPPVAADMTSHIVELVDLDISYVRSEAIINLAGMARVFPAVKSLIVPCLSRCLRRTENGEAKAAVVWMIGEFGEEIVEAPYMIEPYIDSYDEDTPSVMKLQLLVAAMKLFFKRPPEMHLMLGRLLKFAVNDTANQDVHDRAMLYHRVLSADVSTAETMFLGARDAASATGADGAPLLFFEVSNTEMRDKVFEEFNSLAVIYGYPSAQFIDPIFEKAKIERVTTPFSISASSGSQQASTQSYSSTATVSFSGSVNLLDMGEDSSPVVASKVAEPTVHSLRLMPNVQLAPSDFQKVWVEKPEALNRTIGLLSRVPVYSADVETAMKTENVFTMASGALPDGSGLKFFFYAGQEDTGSNDLLGGGGGNIYYLVQLILLNSGQVNAVIKTSGDSSVAQNAIPDVIFKALNAFGPTKM